MMCTKAYKVCSSVYQDLYYILGMFKSAQLHFTAHFLRCATSPQLLKNGRMELGTEKIIFIVQNIGDIKNGT